MILVKELLVHLCTNCFKCAGRNLAALRASQVYIPTQQWYVSSQLTFCIGKQRHGSGERHQQHAGCVPTHFIAVALILPATSLCMTSSNQ
jgi:hypothetical protein